jgi:radical SAM family protein
MMDARLGAAALPLKAIHNLEIHAAHACNLACESCSHYSNHGHKGIVSLEDADRWMGAWSQRIAPAVFSVLGGEPTIHPDLTAFVALARRHWPDAVLRIVTNGFFLHRHPALPLLLRDDPKAVLYLSIHHDSPEYREKLDPVMDLLGDWVRTHGIQVRSYPSNTYWTRRYRGFGAAMQPFEDGQPRASWEACSAKYCPQLFAERIWKCAALAYLRMQDAKFGLSEKWAPYLEYQPLAPDCTRAELDAFFAREEESHCGMCAAKPARFALPIPLYRSSQVASRKD